MNPTVWPKNERMLLDVLTCRVAVLAMRDARRLWQTKSKEEDFRQGVARLCCRELVEVYALNLRPIRAISRPVLSISAHEDEAVDCESVSRQLRGRWNEQRQQTWIFVASRKAANLFRSTAHGLPKMGTPVKLAVQARHFPRDSARTRAVDT